MQGNWTPSSLQTGREIHTKQQGERGKAEPQRKEADLNVIPFSLISKLKPGVYMPTFVANIKNGNQHCANVYLMV